MYSCNMLAFECGSICRHKVYFHLSVHNAARTANLVYDFNGAHQARNVQGRPSAQDPFAARCVAGTDIH